MTREEVIYRLNNTAWLGSDADRVATEEAVKMAIEALKEQKTGKWTIEDCHAATYKYCCSECNAHHRARYDFCPTCGARMVGDEE